MIASMSTGLPAQWTAMMARVRSVMRCSTSPASMLQVSGSQSQKTGTPFWSMMPCTVPMSVTGVVMTSSPGSSRTAATAAWRAPEPESVEQAYLTPCNRANSSSNASTIPDECQLPVAHFSSTSRRWSRSSWPKSQRAPNVLVVTGSPPSIASLSST